MDEQTPATLLERAALAGTQPITDDALLRRLRSEATTWVNAVQMQRSRLKPSQNRDLWEVEIDLHFLLVALVRLERAVIRAVDETGLKLAMASELEAFITATPGLRRMRDVGEHADEYNLSKGRRSFVPRAQVQSWSRTPLSVSSGAGLGRNSTSTPPARLLQGCTTVSTPCSCRFSVTVTDDLATHLREVVRQVSTV